MVQGLVLATTLPHPPAPSTTPPPHPWTLTWVRGSGTPLSLGALHPPPPRAIQTGDLRNATTGGTTTGDLRPVTRSMSPGSLVRVSPIPCVSRGIELYVRSERHKTHSSFTLLKERERERVRVRHYFRRKEAPEERNVCFMRTSRGRKNLMKIIIHQCLLTSLLVY